VVVEAVVGVPSTQLRDAATRSLDVRPLVPGKGDVAITQWVARAASGTLRAAGVRIWEYQPVSSTPTLS